MGQLLPGLVHEVLDRFFFPEEEGISVSHNLVKLALRNFILNHSKNLEVFHNLLLLPKYENICYTL